MLSGSKLHSLIKTFEWRENGGRILVSKVDLTSIFQKSQNEIDFHVCFFFGFREFTDAFEFFVRCVLSGNSIFYPSKAMSKGVASNRVLDFLPMKNFVQRLDGTVVSIFYRH